MARAMHPTAARLRNGLRTRAFASTALVAATVYLLWRSTTLGSGWTLLLSIPWFVAELWAFAQLAALSYKAWRLPEAPEAEAASIANRAAVDVLISATRADQAEVERSLVGAASLRGRGRIVVVDTLARSEIRAVARSSGAAYVTDSRAAASPGQAVHAHARSELYLWLEAGQVPMPDLLVELAPRFDRESLAVCQSAVGLLNADSLVHLRGGRDEEALLRNVIGPGLDRRGTAPWFGPASLIRRSAVDAAGGFSTDDPAAVERLLVNMHCRGWASAFDAQKLVRATARSARSGSSRAAMRWSRMASPPRSMVC